MDIERLRALENRLRDEAGQHEINALEADSVGATEAAVGQEWRSDLKRELADELATLIAELGQEVGAVYAHPVELEAARRNYARGLADGLLTVSVQPIPGFVPLYNSSATPTAAADSERLDWVINHPGQVVTKWGHESSWHVVGAITGHIISRGHASYREAIDAAMRQARR